MKLSDAILVCRELIGKTNEVPFLLGESGIGKSEGIRYGVAEPLGMKVVDLRLAQMEPSDAIGMPRVVQGADGEWMTVYGRPWWFPKPEDPPTLIFLDELPQAPRDVQAAMFQLILDRRLFQHELAPQHKVICAGNPAIGDYESEELGRALRTRLLFLVVEPSLEDWLAWSQKLVKDFPAIQSIREFVSIQPQALFKGVGEEIKIDIPANPRSWTKLGIILSVCNIPERLQYEVAAGKIGKEWAIPFLKHFRETMHRPVTAKEIFTDYEAVRERIRRSGQDELNATCQDVVAYCSDMENEVTIEPIVELLKDLPNEFRFTLVRSLLRLGDDNSEERARMKKLLPKSREVYEILSRAKQEMQQEG